MARTKIVVTLGPATDNLGIIRRLIEKGADVFRLNFSHGTPEEHARRIVAIRKAATGSPIAIIGDLCGPKIRCGRFANEPATLKEGKPFILTARAIEGTDGAVSVSYKRLPREVKRGDAIFLDDGNIELRAEEVSGSDIRCRVIRGGDLRSNKGINLPGTTLSIPALTPQDRRMIKFGVEQNLDYFALSFVKSPRDIYDARRLIGALGADTPIIAKIEKHEAVRDLEAIIEAADGALVARGDLGVEVPLEQVPLIQKRIIALCNRRAKPVITATQMLESMIEKARPTRAEAADIANAILDGTDAVMLSGETAVGKFPCEAVEIMDKIAQTAEENLDERRLLMEQLLPEEGNIPDAISQATAQMARSLNASAILCCSITGYTARFVARYRPPCPIAVFTLNPKIQRRLQVVWGVVPILMKEMKGSRERDGFDAIIREAVKETLRKQIAKRGDRVIVTAGLPLGVGGATNMLRVLEI
ncbi:MAG TPA: pyruvate kinase [Candidatus Sumerlaeota bacterium]|nr:pyruvate kinase [Candidatus Sumerlaeota bacterium]HON49191.1 pyruvate kinase [Candidatus Sumerlaeota bacterium]HOR64202.1 pyruvate kinase [Candidatus Sumerlaeota bacterium]HPL73215.1 pyruvate kinase [Candidatus Sumerlaeota bacterium]HRU54077.1 pyruvate kinase [Candidatus Sumerlaeia bacterium]